MQPVQLYRSLQHPSIQDIPQTQSMDVSHYLLSTPWDARAIGVNTFEITETADDSLRNIVQSLQPGHYTVRVAPTASKQVLHECGFYYCDTLLEPYCSPDWLVDFYREGVCLSQSVALDDLLNICHGAFSHGRFHRDFNVDKSLADIRYDLWLKDIYELNTLFGLMYQDQLAGFLAFSNNKIILHALSQEYRGQGLAKVFWSLSCHELFKKGFTELTSSISAANTNALNLYISLGFRFRNPMDIYHLLIS